MNNYAKIRLAVFLAVLVSCALAERLFPRRKPVAPAGRRWLLNLGLGGLGSIAVSLLPLAPLQTSFHAEQAGFGLLNLWPGRFVLRFILSIILLDLLIYWQHRLFHGPAVLWRLHSLHHGDADLDSSSGLRFHPGELLISSAIKCAGVALLGAHFLAVAAFEILLNAASIFNHANIALPGFLDQAIRLVLVTPDMHRVHHSASSDETNSNFGFASPWWDRLFGTYRAQPREPHETMTLGLPS
ncbi:MAG: sterol desaturase family protein [Elusimicrobia bacterium]|nr:sterol desaturase family protein [Elusimicrobiota bacterium]